VQHKIKLYFFLKYVIGGGERERDKEDKLCLDLRLGGGETARSILLFLVIGARSSCDMTTLCRKNDFLNSLDFCLEKKLDFFSDKNPDYFFAHFFLE